MSGKSFATQCPHCPNYGNHDCCTQDKWLLTLYPPRPSFIIEDIVINLREYEQKEVYYTLHQRKCSNCGNHFVSIEIAENFLRALLEKAEALKETNSENEKLENENKNLKQRNERLINALKEANSKLNEIARISRSA